MITESILNAFQSIVTFILSLLPNLPQMPSGISDASQGLVDSISQVIGVISYIYTPTMLVFVFTLLLAVLGFDLIYKFVLWVLHKVRG